MNIAVNQTRPVVRVQNLKKHFSLAAPGLFSREVPILKAVDGLSFDILPGETLGLVGESGCGKSTVGRTIVKLYEPTEGSVEILGKNLAELSAKDMRLMRRNMQMVFQDPYSSLDPRYTVSELIGEALDIHGLARGKARKERISELLSLVGLDSAVINRRAKEFSGGQRQRISIARALAVEPKFIVCDESISALDVSIQAQIVNLLKRLQSELKLSYLFIAHDLGVVRHAANRIAVMYLGKIVEIADRDELFANPRHPYTKSLLSAIPIPDPVAERSRQRILLQGDLPSPINPPTGCRFSSRCPFVQQKCRAEEPSLDAAGPNAKVACHFWQSLNTQ